MRRARSGFVLVVVLWTIVCASAVVAGLLMVARESIGAVRNRISLEKGAWIAEGCLEIAKAEITAAIAPYRAISISNRIWDIAQETVRESAVIASCGGQVTLSAVGTALNINKAPESQLRRLLLAQQRDTARVDSLVSALLDWRDADDVPRRLGAEEDWYSEANRHLPRNGKFASVLELKLVRGFETMDSLAPLLTVEDGRVVVGLAPLGVISSLPGTTPALIDNLARNRESGEMISELGDLGANLALDDKAIFAAGFRDLARMAAITPDAWLLTASAGGAPHSAAVTIELRVVPAGSRLATLRRRIW